MKIEEIKIDALVNYDKNSRTHSQVQINQIVDSINEFGFTNPLLIDDSNLIIAGHGRLAAAKKIKLKTVPCIRLSNLTELQKRAYVIADNKIALNAGWDQDMLNAELSALSDLGYILSTTGFTDEEVDDLLIFESKEDDKDPDALPDVKKHTKLKIKSSLGDVWLLGDHRLMVGDSTSKKDINKLMAGDLADCCWTDPPYNVAYETNAGKIANDSLSDANFKKFLNGFYSRAFESLKPGAAIYVAHADTEGTNFRSEFSAAGFKLSGVLIWKKNAMVLGRSDYQWIHEPILYGWKPGASHKFWGGRKKTTFIEYEKESENINFEKQEDGKWHINLGHGWLVVDDNTGVGYIKGSILEIAKPSRNALHPTMKPVSLVEKMLRNSARANQIVFDPFGGSGTTLIACDRLKMKARICELDTTYCDRIIQRWQEYTGGFAVLESNGELFDDIK